MWGGAGYRLQAMNTNPSPSAASRQLDRVQLLRAFAALAVLVHHAMQQANGAARLIAPHWLTTAGAAGVDVFFVISGFIMAWIAFRRPDAVPTPTRFLAERITRIAPLYWLCCGVVLVLAGAGLMRSVDTSVAGIFASLALVPHEGRLLGVAWALEYELLFYAIFALCLPLRRAGPALLGAAGAIGLILMAAQGLPDGAARRFLGDPIMLEFAGGMGLGWLLLRHPERRGVPGWLALAAAAALLLAPIAVPHETTDGLRGWARLGAWGLPSVLIVSWAVSGSGAGRGRAAGLLQRIGNASYALYLTHGLAMFAYAAALKRTGLGSINQWPVVALLVIGCVGAAIIVHERIERPVTAWARARFGGQRVARRPVEAVAARG